MSKTTSIPPVSAIGLDLGDRRSHLCCLGPDRKVSYRQRISMTRKSVQRAFERFPKETLVVMEVGTHSPWVSQVLQSLGLKVIVADARQLKLITQSRKKTDRRDAELLARLGLADIELLHPIQHRGELGQLAATMLRARESLVRSRTALVNAVRGMVKTHGYRLKAGSTDSIHKRGSELPEELQPALLPLLNQCGSLTAQIRAYDRKLEKLAQENFPETQRMRQVQGVGLLTALAVSVAVQDPGRFKRAREVGAYFGLVPSKRESGDQRPQMRISKTGNEMVRRHLVTAAHYILGPFCGPSALRHWGLRLAARGGPAGKKRAVVAVARKLGVLLIALWRSGEEYEPLRGTAAEPQPGTFMGKKKAG
ncbi:MAG: IS110 family RNA-guided transposase [Planctomycetota bacterium]